MGKIIYRLFVLSAIILFCLNSTAKAVDSLRGDYLVDGVVSFRLINKITAKPEIIKIPINEQIKYHNLFITAKKCWKSVRTEKDENIALISIIEQKPQLRKSKKLENKKLIFNGWIFSSSPSLSVFEHAIYDLTLLNCANQIIH